MAAAIAWGAAAGIEWHWEMPVVTLWFFALGGAAIAGRRDREAPARSLRLLPRVLVAGACCAVLALVPLRLAVSQDRVESAYLALRQGDCARVDRAAADSLKAVGSRPAPYELMAACELRAKRYARAIHLINEAVRRDPDNWRPRYSLAVIRARARQDPRPAARAAARLNPQDPLTKQALAAFNRGGSPAAWSSAARPMRLPVPPL